MQEKKILRNEMLVLRNNMTKEDVEQKSKVICENILQSKIILQFNDIMLYYPIKNEVDLRYLFLPLNEQKKNIWLPVVNGKNMSFHLYENEQSLKPGAYGIPEPESSVVYKGKEESCLVFMPGLAFTEKRDRLGYGGGYYDRFLDNHKCYTVAVAFDTQIVVQIPNETHDKRPDMIITDKRTVR